MMDRKETLHYWNLKSGNYDGVDIMQGYMAIKRASEFAAEKTECQDKYQELIMAVESKCSGETRHQTALRYIKSFENGVRAAAKILTTLKEQ